MGFHLHRDGQSTPYDIAILREMARKGELAQDEYIYDDKKGEWIGAAQVPEMVGAWNIQEDEATVAMELPADFSAMFEEEQRKRAAAQQAAPQPPRSAEPVKLEKKPAPVRQEEPLRLPESGGSGRGGAGFGGGGFGGSGGGRANLQPGPILNPITVVILAMVTCGIYPLVWMFKRAAEINVFLGREEIKTTHLIIGLFCFPLILMGIWKMIKALPEMGQKAGVQIEDRSTLLMICALCVAPAFYYLVQTDLNTIWQASGAQPAR